MLLKDYKTLPPNELIEKCINKDHLAWAEFISRYSDIAFRAIRKRLENHNSDFNIQDVEDLRQAFFMKLWHEESLAQLKDSENINYWVCLVAANFATDFYRRSQKDILKDAVSIFDEVVINNQKKALHNFLKSSFPSVKEKNALDTLDGIISDLNPKEKIALKLNLFHKKKHREISKILKIPIASASSLLSRAKKKIKNNLQENGLFLRFII